MKKSRIYWIILDLIFLIVFNILFFSMAGAKGHPASVWISYGFIHGAYALLLLTPYFVTKGKSADVYGYSLYTIASGYFLIELVAGVIFILLHPQDWKPALIVQIVLMAAYAFAMLTSMLANEKTASNEARIQNDLKFVRNASAQLESIMNGTEKKEIKKLVEKAYDAAKSCQVKSSPAVAALESGMMNQIGAIQRVVFSEETESVEKEVQLFVRMAQERERQLRMSN